VEDRDTWCPGSAIEILDTSIPSWPGRTKETLGLVPAQDLEPGAVPASRPCYDTRVELILS
jgi:hypothetical protein